MPDPRVFVPAMFETGASVPLTSDEAHHVAHVLRLGVGAAVTIFDGRGHEWDARIASAGRPGVTVAIGATRTPAPEPPVRVTLAIGLLKGDQMDAVVRDATMLGAAAIVPMVTAHVAVPKRARGEATDRWTRIAIASAKQCRRAVVPDILPMTTFEDLVGRPQPAMKILCAEPAQQISPSAVPDGPRPADVLVLIGPEGGWSDAEMAHAARGHLRRLHLGPRTLRADAAPIVALTALWMTWGW